MTQVTTLTKYEKRLFGLPPKFSKYERNVYFSLTSELKRTISRFNTYDMRAGFMLQLAYFRANARFYPIVFYLNCSFSRKQHFILLVKTQAPCQRSAYSWKERA